MGGMNGDAEMSSAFSTRGLGSCGVRVSALQQGVGLVRVRVTSRKAAFSSCEESLAVTKEANL